MSGQSLIEISNFIIFGFPFEFETVGEDLYPQLVDLDGDLDVDFVYGNELGDIYMQENIGTPTAPLYDCLLYTSDAADE